MENISMSVEETVKKFFKTISDTIFNLSNKKEEYLKLIPPWCISTDILIIYYVESKKYSIYTNSYRKKDEVSLQIINNKKEFIDKLDFINSWLKESRDKCATSMLIPNQYPSNNTLDIGISGMVFTATSPKVDMIIVNDEHSDTLSEKDFDVKFSEENAKQMALYEWNCAFLGKSIFDIKNFDLYVKGIIDRLEQMVNLKAFKERKIHRYIYCNSDLILPPHKKCYFEKSLQDVHGEYRTSDFILERECGMPPILIELERPGMKLCTKKKDFTCDANHAKHQIAEWVDYINTNSANLSNGFEFLSGKKDRLVIGGRGLEYYNEMKNSKNDDTIMWTYDMLIREAKIRLNAEAERQNKIVGKNKPPIFKIKEITS